MDLKKMRELNRKINELKKRYRTTMFVAPEDIIADNDRFEHNNRRPKNRYNYYNFFNYSTLLGEKISKLLQLILGEDILFQVLNFKKDELGVFVYVPQDGEFSYVHKANSSFLVAAREEAIKELTEQTFESKKQIKKKINSICIVGVNADGVISPDMFTYPEMQEFFYHLNVWRLYTGRATLDEQIIETSFQEVVNNMNADTIKGR